LTERCFLFNCTQSDCRQKKEALVPTRIIAAFLFLLFTSTTIGCTTTNQPPANSGREDRSR
jgi:hypothetical protein